MTHTKRILDIISQFKDITQKEIVELIDDPSGINFSSRLVGMFNNGLVTRKKVDRDGREVWAYTATGKTVSRRQGKSSAATIAKPKPEPKAINSALYNELEELREWKRRALIVCPELNVDPLVYKAREIFARHTDDKKLKDEIYSGKLDKRPPMLAIVEALENAT